MGFKWPRQSEHSQYTTLCLGPDGEQAHRRMSLLFFQPPWLYNKTLGFEGLKGVNVRSLAKPI